MSTVAEMVGTLVGLMAAMTVAMTVAVMAGLKADYSGPNWVGRMADATVEQMEISTVDPKAV